MPLTSTSTLAEINAAYEDNAGYDLNGNAAECKQFILACRILLNRIPKRMRNGGQSGDEWERNPSDITAELKKAEDWLAANSPTQTSRSSGGGVVFLHNTGFRD